MTTNLKTTPKDVFLNLLMMAMLYLSIISLIILSFAYINYLYPDPLSYYLSGNLDTIRYSSSMVFITAPLLIYLNFLIQKDFQKNPAKHELKFSKWLVYLTLFVTALTIIIDLIQLIYNFYGGELTLPFTLKVVSILIFAGSVFAYYLWDTNRTTQKSKIPVNVAWIFSLTVLSMLIAGFFIIGSPAKQRALRMDEQRINDLQNIQNEIINYWQNKEILPPDLESLQNNLTGFKAPLDPENQSNYKYTILDNFKFELCAKFSYPNQSNNRRNDFMPIGPVNENWNHSAGEQCFERTIDPDLFPKPIR